MPVLSPAAIFRHAMAAGFSADEAVTMTAIALAESGGNTGARNMVNEQSIGLWQINLDAHAGRVGDRNLTVPAVNAEVAFEVYTAAGGSISPWTVTHLSKGGRYRNYQEQAIQAAIDAGFSDATGNFAGSVGYGTMASAGSPEGRQETTAVPTKVKIPAGGQLLRTPYAPAIRYELFPPVPGVHEGIYIDFIVDPALVDLAGSGYSLEGAPNWFEPTGELIPASSAGFATELAVLVEDGYNSLSQWMTDTIGMLFSPNNPAWEDPDVLRIFGEWIADPDLEPDVIMGRIRHETDYWNDINQKAADWFQMSEAEQQRQVSEEAGRISDSFWNIMGPVDGDRVGADDEQIMWWAEKVASGQMTMQQVNDEIRDRALENPESPWSRAIRTEEEAQLDRGNEIEDMVGTNRDLALQWGVEMSDAGLQGWAKNIVEGTRSEQDYRDFLKNQAQVLYAWKDPEVPTMVAATPWLTAYETILETGEVSLFNADIQKALTEGESIAEFRRRLKSDPRWLETKNFQDLAGSTLSALNTRFGF